MTAQLHVTHPAAHAPDGRAQDQAHPGQPRHRPARTLDTIDAAIAEVRAGRPIIVVDDEDRENEGDLIMAAELANPAWMGFIVRHTSGVICTPMTAARASALELPPMTAVNEDPKGTAYTVSCDAIEHTSTGISAADRARTVRVVAEARPRPQALSRPGHIFPLIAKDGGVRERPGHTEAGVELSRLAGLQPVSVIAELVHDDGSMMRLDALLAFGREHGLVTVSIEDLVAWLEAHDDGEADGGSTAGSGASASTSTAGARPAAPALPTPVLPGTSLPTAPVPGTSLPEAAPGAPVALPSAHGQLRAQAWTVGGVEHLVISGEAPAGTVPLVRLHSECLTGDVFGSHRCDCGEQLHVALRRIAAEGGTLVYLRDHEGRGIGLANKLAAYALQEQGIDTVDANRELGFADDARSYAAAAAILAALGLDRVRLLTNNPAKIAALTAHGIAVEAREPIEVPVRVENARYLETKRVRMHHSLTAGTDGTEAAGEAIGAAGAAGTAGAASTERTGPFDQAVPFDQEVPAEQPEPTERTEPDEHTVPTEQTEPFEQMERTDMDEQRRAG